MVPSDDRQPTTQLTASLPASLVRRIDGMVGTLSRYSPLPNYGPIDRDLVIRLALTQGLDSMEAEYGEPTVETRRDALLGSSEETP